MKGKGSFLPDYIRNIALPEFRNATEKFELERILAEKLEEEFVNRGDYSIVQEKEDADAILTGTITDYFTSPKSIGEDGRATSYLIKINVNVIFRDLKTNKVIFTANDYSVSEEYQLTDSEEDFLDQEEYAIEEAVIRLSESLVGAILEGF